MRLRVILALFGLSVAWTVSASAADLAPLELVADVPLSGAAARFDYQSLDVANNRLYIAHMDADQLVVFAGPWTRYRWSEAPQWTAEYAPSHFVHLVHGLPATHLDQALRIARRRFDVQCGSPQLLLGHAGCHLRLRGQQCHQFLGVRLRPLVGTQRRIVG